MLPAGRGLDIAALDEKIVMLLSSANAHFRFSSISTLHCQGLYDKPSRVIKRLMDGKRGTMTYCLYES